MAGPRFYAVLLYFNDGSTEAVTVRSHTAKHARNQAVDTWRAAHPDDPRWVDRVGAPYVLGREE